MPGCKDMSPGGAVDIFGLICCKTVLPDVNIGWFNCVIVNAVVPFILEIEDCGVTVTLGLLQINLFTAVVVVMHFWVLFVVELWPVRQIIYYVNEVMFIENKIIVI